MINTVYAILNPLGYPLKWNVLPDITKSHTVISYHFFNEGELLHGDGGVIEEGGVLQVDIFSTTDYTSTVREVKKLLKCAGFLFESARDDKEMIDSNTMLYHKILVFNYIESVVK